MAKEPIITIYFKKVVKSDNPRNNFKKKRTLYMAGRGKVSVITWGNELLNFINCEPGLLPIYIKRVCKKGTTMRKMVTYRY